MSEGLLKIMVKIRVLEKKKKSSFQKADLSSMKKKCLQHSIFKKLFPFQPY